MALAEQATTVTLKHLRKTALHKEKVDLAWEAILDGEKGFLEAEDADLSLLIKLGLRQTTTPDLPGGTDSPPSPVSPAKPRERTPGERAPDRDPVGMIQTEQDRKPA